MLPPQAFLERMQRLLGSEYQSFVSIYAHPPVPGLRVNTLKIAVDRFLTISPFPLTPIPWCPSGFLYPSDFQPGKHPFHAAGLYYLQDPSAMAVAEILAPQPGEWVLDLAAAPGGKTTHLACWMMNQGFLVANEIHPRRAWELAANLERCGIRNAAILNESPQRLADALGDRFDRVLLDAPCSGEGMFRKSQPAREEWSPDLVLGCAARQSAILEDAARLVRPGGFLAYSTCTFAPEENEEVIARFLKTHPGFSLVMTGPIPGSSAGRPDWIEADPVNHIPLERAARFWPHTGAPEGHSIALMQKIGQERPARKNKVHGKPLFRPSSVARAALRAFWKNTLTTDPPEENLAQVGSYIYLLPEGGFEPGELNIIHPGWWLGILKKDRFEPAHALAMGLDPGQAQRMVRLAEQVAPRYLRGETLPVDGENGWALVTIRGGEDDFPLGWGKRVGGIVKNEYPRGLRWPG